MQIFRVIGLYSIVMIAALQGKIIQKSPGQAVLDVGGVGYEVLLSLRSYEALPALHQEVQLFVQTIVREDAIILYGFASAEEKKLFLLLIGVSGIGPKLALTTLGGFSVVDLQKAIASRDIGRLTTVPGVGKKTAERICMELAEKVALILDVPEMPGIVSPGPASGMPASPQADAASALINLGYGEQQVWQALRSLEKEQDTTAYALEDWLRQALRRLATAR